MTRPPLIFEGVQFDLDHLAPARLLCPRIGGGPDLVIDVTFGHHAYTVAVPKGQALSGAVRVTERDDVRLFDVVRWQQSRDHLPDMIAGLPGAKVEFTPEKRNFRYALKARLADSQEYALFLSLRRSSDADYDLRMVVESAYAIPAGGRARAPGEIRFGVLAMKVMRGEIIRIPPRW